MTLREDVWKLVGNTNMGLEECTDRVVEHFAGLLRPLARELEIHMDGQLPSEPDELLAQLKNVFFQECREVDTVKNNLKNSREMVELLVKRATSAEQEVQRLQALEGVQKSDALELENVLLRASLKARDQAIFLLDQRVTSLLEDLSRSDRLAESIEEDRDEIENNMFSIAVLCGVDADNLPLRSPGWSSTVLDAVAAWFNGRVLSTTPDETKRYQRRARQLEIRIWQVQEILDGKWDTGSINAARASVGREPLPELEP